MLVVKDQGQHGEAVTNLWPQLANPNKSHDTGIPFNLMLRRGNLSQALSPVLDLIILLTARYLACRFEHVFGTKSLRCNWLRVSKLFK